MVPGASAFAVTPNDTFFNEQWYLQQINAVSAWDKSTGSHDVIVAVIDTGIDLDHPDIRNQIFVNSGETPYDGIDNDGNGYIDDISGWDFYDDNNDANPVVGANNEFGVHHGTVIAGVIGATGNNAAGIAGINWDVRIMPLRVLDSTGDGDVGDIVEAIDYAVLMGVDVINLSFVGDNNTPSLDQALQNAYDHGVVVVAAMGNVTDTGSNLDSVPLYPVCSPGTGVDDVVIGVVATDKDDRRAIFSNYGSACADIAAPGEWMYSTQVDGYSGGWNGTSLATPVVAGAAAMMKAIYPYATPKEILLTMKLSVDPVVGRAPSGVYGALGSGRLNLARALDMLPRLVANNAQRVAEVVVVDETPDPAPVEILPVVTQEPPPRQLLTPFAAGAGAGDEPRVTVFDYNGERASFLAYTPAFRGGVSVATGQVDGDSGYEVVTGAGAGGGPHVRVFNDIGALKYQFFAFSPGFTGGIDVATGDVTGDGVDEIIVVPGEGRDPVARVFNWTGTLLAEIPVASSGSALAVSSGDVDGDGIAEIVITEGKGSAPAVRVYRYNSTMLSEFFVYAQSMFKGVRSAVLPLAGRASIVVGTDTGAGPHVRSFDRIGALAGQFFAFSESDRGGADVMAWEPYGDGQWFIVTSGMIDDVPTLKVFNKSGTLQDLDFTLPDHKQRVNL